MAHTVSSDEIKKLRDLTGAGMMDCKNALIEHEGDVSKASDALRARGLAKAAKREGKETACGRVISYIHGEGRIGVLLQLNCETDFVARNPEFEALGRELAMQVASSGPLCVRAEDIDPAVLEKEAEIVRAQLKEEGKKAEQIEKIVPGKLKKFQSEVCLMEQAFIKDPKLSVTDHIKAYIAKFGENITVARFARFQVG
ncbi:MAG: translation elongation factor Ts [Spirochaetia bacterium]|nr:translation elongation factor Ts [Spirochaetia bacterium]